MNISSNNFFAYSQSSIANVVSPLVGIEGPKGSDARVSAPRPIVETNETVQKTTDKRKIEDPGEVVDKAKSSATKAAVAAEEPTKTEEQIKAEKEAKDKAEQAQLVIDQQKIQQLASRDQEVKRHEQAHASVGGSYAGSPVYEYTRGPNGKSYAVEGHVNISVSKAATPEKTIDKMQQVRAAALAPAEPSGADRKVAATASQITSEARIELAELTREEASIEREERVEARVEKSESDSSASKSADTTDSSSTIDDTEQGNRTQSDVDSRRAQRGIDSFTSVFSSSTGSSSLSISV